MDSNRDEQSGAIAEGRRIYLGNLLYATKPNEIEQALEEHGFGNYVQIHVSVDPVSGRNPGYCFVDFQDRETAEAALTDLVATVRGRPLKVGPCQPKQQGQRRDNNGGSRWGPSQRESNYNSSSNNNGDSNGSGNNRWGDWKRGTDGRNGNGNTSGSRGQPDHFNNQFSGDRQEPSGKRVYIGGLGKMVDQDQNQAEISELLAGHNPLTIGKRITARDRETQEAKPNANYCFVDFATTDEAQRVVDALNGMDYGDAGGYLRVSIARGAPERRDNNNQDGGNNNNYSNGGRQQNNYRNRQKPDDAGVQRAFDSNNWRRKE
ncbi:hypothetical protein SBRCBS47491_004515 [Sporothrix bragantina]|uniref:RRM domain-containing protein n=1 Tax=Sporothrix bragantina TaxID=671064 RepID=A0ABP0BNZ9_9PEZI